MNNKILSFSKEINRENIAFKNQIPTNGSELNQTILQNFRWLEQNSIDNQRILF